ncbi:cyclin d5 1 [Euphorbia peplus]|nr:cyclin d5 1 [Euphorbia peplus]
MPLFDDSDSFSSLLCQEDESSCFILNQDFNFNPFVLQSDEIEYIETMVQRESRSFDDHSSVFVFDSFKYSRLDAIEWIFNTRAVFGFRFHTAYLSVVYFDRFLSKRSIDDGKEWAIRLLSVACLSLAAKMEECRVPLLSEFSMDDYCFENKVIQRMELLVLNTLEWKMGLITPFSYLHYFIYKIYGESRSKDTISRAAELILAVVKEINLLDHRPSFVAAAAVLAASDSRLTRQELELKMKQISSWGSLENENIFSCYIVMQEIEMGKDKTPKKEVISPNSSSSVHSSLLLENLSFNSTGAATKRRLTYNDCDQNCPVKKLSQEP